MTAISYELAEVQGAYSQRVEDDVCRSTILLSVISLLNEPNIYSAAHVDASVSYRRWKESNGRDDEYEKIVKALVQQTFADAERDGVQVPTTLEEYCISGRPAGDLSKSEVDNDSSDFDGDYGYCASDVEDEDDDNSTPDVKQAAASGSLLDTGADSAMEETESEPHTRSRHNMQSVYQHSDTSIISQMALHSRDCQEMITHTACASASKPSSDISDNASAVMRRT
ncbi:ubiquitin-conjugating enzyme E2 R [Paragonimus westermani]|uniref:Ubiquitin-conjugating enzyme E2 R n=1 Tax=Paragonimus westermani TaxID=34504 RepID=A0A5J4NJ47_9TREM|nr:ubiquitin-conjugating enzyme E2 R [Paragonimus westermani]